MSYILWWKPFRGGGNHGNCLHFGAITIRGGTGSPDFIRIVEFELFGAPKWLKLTVLNPGLKPLNFIKIVEFELFGAPKWLNFTVLNPGLKPLNFYQNRRI